MAGNIFAYMAKNQRKQRKANQTFLDSYHLDESGRRMIEKADPDSLLPEFEEKIRGVVGCFKVNAQKHDRLCRLAGHDPLEVLRKSERKGGLKYLLAIHDDGLRRMPTDEKTALEKACRQWPESIFVESYNLNKEFEKASRDAPMDAGAFEGFVRKKFAARQEQAGEKAAIALARGVPYPESRQVAIEKTKVDPGTRYGLDRYYREEQEKIQQAKGDAPGISAAIAGLEKELSDARAQKETIEGRSQWNGAKKWAHLPPEQLDAIVPHDDSQRAAIELLKKREGIRTTIEAKNRELAEKRLGFDRAQAMLKSHPAGTERKGKKYPQKPLPEIQQELVAARKALETGKKPVAAAKGKNAR